MQNFEKRLKYNKYKNMDNIITIDLHNGYTIISFISKNTKNEFDVTLMLKENTIDTWMLIEDFEHIIFNSNIKNIYSAILKTVSISFHHGYFDYYFARYEYEIHCFVIKDRLSEILLKNYNLTLSNLEEFKLLIKENEELNTKMLNLKRNKNEVANNVS